MRIQALALALFLGTTPLVTTGCGSKQPWSIAAAQGGGVSIQPIEGYVKAGKLWIRADVINGTGQPIVVVRDAVRCILPNGSSIGRASGKTTLHQPYVIPPGGAHAVYVEFEGEFETVPNARIDFSQAVTANGQPIGAPAILVQNPGPS